MWEAKLVNSFESFKDVMKNWYGPKRKCYLCLDMLILFMFSIHVHFLYILKYIHIDIYLRQGALGRRSRTRFISKLFYLVLFHILDLFIIMYLFCSRINEVVAIIIAIILFSSSSSFFILFLFLRFGASFS